MPRGKKGSGAPKDKFAELDEDFKNEVAGMDEAGIKARIASITLNQAALIEARDNDQDLTNAKETAKVAGAVYREGTKANKLRIGFCRRVLGDKGKDTGDSGLA